MTRGRPTLEGVLRVLCVAVGGWILAALTLLTVVHVDDRFRVNHVSGVWMALARYTGDGTLYPPLYDGEHFGGTRFMPLQWFLHAGLGEATGEYLVSGKLLTAAIALALLGVMLLALRQVGAPAWLGLPLVALLITSQSGLTAFTSIRGDALPVALQLGAVLVVARGMGRREAAVAGLLCAGALLGKVSAVWAPLAIVAWLLARERRSLGTFVATYAFATGLALGLLEILAEGRFSENMVGLAGSALADPAGLADALLAKPLTLIESDAAAVSIILPLALAELVLAVREQRLGVEHLAFLACVPVTLVLMVDIGAVSNHLLDLQVLTIVLAGHLWAVYAPRQPAVGVLAVVGVLWAAAATYVIDMHPDVRNAARSALGRPAAQYRVAPAESLIDADSPLLSEDPTLAVVSDRRPTVLDPFMLIRILELHPEWGEDIVLRLERKEFGSVVLLADHVGADGSIDVSHPRWRQEHFGAPTVAAIARNYRLRLLEGSYALFVPRRARGSEG